MEVINNILLPTKLTKTQEKNIHEYKYNFIETSPLVIYFYRPWWDFCASFVPDWASPNLITIIGCCFMTSYYLADCWANPELSAPGPNYTAFPLLAISLGHFIGHTFDGVDGRLARKRGQSSFVGELLDHTIDAFINFNMSIVIASLLAGEIPYNNKLLQYCLALTVAQGTTLMHTEKLFTTALFIPWTVEISHMLLSIFTAILAYQGYVEWNYYISVYIIYIHVPIVNLSMFFALYKAVKADVAGKGKRAVGVPAPFYILYTLMYIWHMLTGLLNGGVASVNPMTPRLFYLALVSKNASLTLRLIFSQTAGLELALFNSKLLLYFLDIVAVIISSLVWPEMIDKIALIFGAFSLFQFLHMFRGILMKSCQILDINFLKVNERIKKVE